MPRKVSGRLGPPISGADDDQQAGERGQQDRRANRRAEGGLLGGGHSHLLLFGFQRLAEVLPSRADRAYGWQPLSRTSLRRPDRIVASTLARCDLGGTAEHRRDRGSRHPRGGARRRPRRPAAPLCADRGPDRGDGEGRPAAAPARCCRPRSTASRETEEVERLELAFLRMMSRLEAERRRAGSRRARGPGGGAGAGRARPSRRGQPVADRAAAAARGGPRGGAARARGRARRDQGARQPGDAELLALARQLRPTALDDLGLTAAIGGPGRAGRPPRARGELEARRRLLRPRRRRAAGRLPGGPGGAHQRRPPQRAPSGST